MNIILHTPPEKESCIDPDLDFDELEALLEEEEEEEEDDLDIDPDDLDAPDLEPSDDLDELELLMIESTLEADQRRALKKQQYVSGSPAPYTPAPSYRTVFSCAIFIRSHCTHCGDEVTIFSHFADYQQFSAKIAGKPNCWKRLASRPASLSRPRVFQQRVPGCTQCVPTTGMWDIYQDPPEDRQLSLFSITAEVIR